MINKTTFTFNTEKQNHLHMSWPILKKYYINTGKEISELLQNLNNNHEFDKLLSYLHQNPKKKFIHSMTHLENKIKYYSPMKKKDLFLKFAYLDSSNNKDVIKFADNHGLPKFEKTIYNNAIFPLHKFKDEVKTANELISIYELLLKDDIKELKKIIKRKDKENKKGNISNHWWEIAKIEIEERNRSLDKKQNVIFLFLLYISKVIEKYTINKISPVFKQMKYNPNNFNKHFQVLPGWRCSSLLAALYMQFYLFITENKEISYCKFCGSPFVKDKSTRSDKKFCSNSCRVRNHQIKNSNK